MKQTLDRAVTAALVLAAVTVAGSVVYRTFVAPVSASGRPTKPVFVDEWAGAVKTGLVFGDSTAPVTIVELADLECPACRGFHLTMDEIRKSYGPKVRYVYVSYPIPRHRFALGAARAAECAASVGDFERWVSAVYAKQDSLGLRSWAAFANDAGIADTARIERCARDPGRVQRIENGLAFGKQIGIRGTPTVIVNGWKLPEPPTLEELSRIIDDLLNAKKPFSG